MSGLRSDAGDGGVRTGQLKFVSNAALRPSVSSASSAIEPPTTHPTTPPTRRGGFLATTVLLLLSLLLAWVTLREGGGVKSSIVATHAPRPPSSFASVASRIERRQIHVQVVMIGDSLLSSAYDQSHTFGSSWVQTVEKLLQQVLVGAVLNAPRLRELDCYWNQVLGDTSHSSPFHDDNWPSVFAQSKELLSRGSTEDDDRPPQGVLVKSAHVALFDLPGYNSFQVSATMEMCLSGHLALNSKCGDFLAALQLGLQVASQQDVDEVVFLVYFGAGTNNMLLVPGTWVAEVEAMRLVTVVRNFVEFGLLGEVSHVSGASLRYGSGSIDPLLPDANHRVNESGLGQRKGTQGASPSQPLFPASYGGRRRAVVVAGEIPTVWFFNTETSAFEWHTAPPVVAHHKNHAPWNRGISTGSKPQPKPAPQLSLAFPPARPFCERSRRSDFHSITCQTVCGSFSGDFEIRRLGAQQTRLFETNVLHLMSNWSHTHVGSTRSRAAARPQLLPIRSTMTTDACPEIGTAAHGQGSCLMDHPHLRSGMADCVHFSVAGSRKVALLTLQTFLRDHASLLK